MQISPDHHVILRSDFLTRVTKDNQENTYIYCMTLIVSATRQKSRNEEVFVNFWCKRRSNEAQQGLRLSLQRPVVIQQLVSKCSFYVSLYQQKRMSCVPKQTFINKFIPHPMELHAHHTLEIGDRLINRMARTHNSTL
jgi:hypothetical protein